METASFGSEFVAVGTAVDQIIDFRTTIMYLGVPVKPKSYMFGDNMAVVDNASIPTSAISKRSHLLLTIESRKQLQLDMYSFLGRMENPTMQIFWAYIGDFQLFGHYFNLYFFGMKLLLNWHQIKVEGHDS